MILKIKANIWNPLLLIFFITTQVFYSQVASENILAKIGDNFISKAEFEARLNYLPKQGIESKNSQEGIKKELIYTLLAEKLWANYAKENGFENNISVITAKNVMEKMFIRDELYKREIKDKIVFDEIDVLEAEKKYNKLITVNIYYSYNSDKMFQLYNLITQKLSFDHSKQKEISNKELTLSYGDLQEDIEEIIYGLGIYEYSTPIEMDDVWNIFHIKNIEEREYKNLIDRNNAVKEISKIISSRKENTNLIKFQREFFANKEVDADGNLFKEIAENLSLIFVKKDKGKLYTFNNKDEKIIVFDSEDLRTMEATLDENLLNQPFIKFAENPITVGTFLREISFLSFSVSEPDLNQINIKLNNQLKEYIRHELLAREGYKQGLESSPNVTKWLKIWHENFLYQAVTNDFLINKKNEDQEKSQYSKIENINDPMDTLINTKRNLFIEKTIELSEKYNIEINEEMLKKIKQNNINFFVLRYLGFGGRITAVPSSPPFIDWFLEKEKRSDKNL